MRVLKPNLGRVRLLGNDHTNQTSIGTLIRSLLVSHQGENPFDMQGGNEKERSKFCNEVLEANAHSFYAQNYWVKGI